MFGVWKYFVEIIILFKFKGCVKGKGELIIENVWVFVVRGFILMVY